jgi:FixJ family two-component response regulator
MTSKPLLVSVVDDDESVRESLLDLLKVLGFEARMFSSPKEFLTSGCVEGTKCLILDIAMPQMTGPELHEELKHRGQQTPVIFITAQRDGNLRAKMIENGAVECLFKPFSDTDLQAALSRAFRAK